MFEHLRSIGWTAADAALLPASFPVAGKIARVVSQHRSVYEVDDGIQVINAKIQPSLRKPDISQEQRPVVGDWVELLPEADGSQTIHGFLPRRTALKRGAAGVAQRTQVIASNIDFVLIVCGLDGDFNPRRVERYLAIVQESGARPIIVLTKADKHDHAENARRKIEKLAGADTPVLTLNAKSAAAIEMLAPFLTMGKTIVLVGSSGAGKSTLTNTLLGINKMKTGEVREHDSRGRHTTSHRALMRLPSGACLIDTPGMREIKLLGEEEPGESSFSDIETLSLACKFNDCQHRGEPSCAVQAAIDNGCLLADRFHSYLKLEAEQAAARQRANASEQRNTERATHKTFNARLKEKYGKR